MAADVTADVTGPGVPTYGLECEDHPAARRRGLAQAHAMNAVAKHNRDHHDDGPTADLANLTAACLVALRFMGDTDTEDAAATLILEALTGLTGSAAIRQAEAWAQSRPAITAHVAPF